MPHRIKKGVAFAVGALCLPVKGGIFTEFKHPRRVGRKKQNVRSQKHGFGDIVRHKDHRDGPRNAHAGQKVLQPFAP